LFTFRSFVLDFDNFVKMSYTPRYSVIDIETTGGKAGVGRVTEIAVFIVEGHKIVDEFVSLVNPGCRIPRYISKLTGITNKMVANAPHFYEVARRIVEITEDTILVAHNASFDYTFVKKEFESLGYNYQRKVMCTVKLSRKILPGYQSYSLGPLCKELKIPLTGRHRARGDAHATALLLIHLFEQQGSFILPQDDFDVYGLNPDLDMDKIRTLPEAAGIYYFHNSNKDVIYVGKSRNIRKRVFSHLSAKGKLNLRMKEQLMDVSYELTGSELIALLREYDEINRQKPLFNNAKRHTYFNWGIYSFTDQRGYQRFFINKVNESISQPLDVFSSRSSAEKVLATWVKKYELCPHLSGLEDKTGICSRYKVHQSKDAFVGEESAAAYNGRASEMLKKLNFSSPNFVIFDKGREAGDKSFVWIEKNALRGYGWIHKDETVTHPSQLEDYLWGGLDNSDSRQIIRSWLRNHTFGESMKILKY
jgi:DNA polymerase-3 subunit epsilon